MGGGGGKAAVAFSQLRNDDGDEKKDKLKVAIHT